MDYTDVYKTLKDLAKAQGIPEHYIDRKETLYYDESGNIKHLVADNKKLNAEADTVFILGGVEAENSISVAELKKEMGKSPDVELKSTKYLKGTFSEILRKENFTMIFELIRKMTWHIHFQAVQVLYYGFVDIIDSIEFFQANPIEFKAILYDVLKKDPAKTHELFYRCKYPDIPENKRDEFLSGIIVFIDDFINTDATLSKRINASALILKQGFERAKQQKELVFLCDENRNVWVSPFLQFYRMEIISFPNKQLIFDDEEQVRLAIDKEDIEINNNKVNNFSFADSTTNAMIQVSDFVTSILRKYITFLDRVESEVQSDIDSFDNIQMDNYKLMNQILKASLVFNPMFTHFTASLYTIQKYHKYLNLYGSITNA